MKPHSFLIILFSLVSLVLGRPEEDKVENLPGTNLINVNFDQYSGYLDGTPGRKLHYWLTETQGSALADPLVLWLNGGPGCSSLIGLLSENGPFTVNPNGNNNLMKNQYSWNQNANVLYLESPACVGFSYDENGDCQTGDDEVAEMNYLALQNFFAEYPNYENRAFFITGESYAGIYIPTLVQKIIDGMDTFPINLQGYAIGNGLLSYESNDNSLIFYGNYHALLGSTLWDSLLENCCGGVESQAACDFHNSVSTACDNDVAEAVEIMYEKGLNLYNLYDDCAHPSGVSGSSAKNEYTFALKNLFRRFGDKIHRPDALSDPVCLDYTLERNYLNQPEVREALHISESAADWDSCSDEVSQLYEREYDSTVDIISSVRQGGIRGLIYAGDIDMAVNFLGNAWDVASLGLNEQQAHVKWKVNGDVAGYEVEYNNLDLLTVRGAGHMVPQDMPAEALHMIEAFFNDGPY